MATPETESPVSARPKTNQMSLVASPPQVPKCSGSAASEIR
ncbi:MAG: hypothetical protein ACI9LT_001916 [Pseudoalteromonas distincta]|jgi:hypothetical protein